MKISLERRCTELTETVRQLSADRDQADQQYQQYVAQLNGQLQAATSKVNSIPAVAHAYCAFLNFIPLLFSFSWNRWALTMKG